MTNTDSIESLAKIAFDAYYSTELNDFREYHATLNADDNSNPLFDADALADMLADDIRDLLHNSNESDLFPFLDDLPESESESLSARFHDDFDELNRLADAIAALMIASE